MFFKSLNVSIGSDGDNVSVSSKSTKTLVRKNAKMSLGIFAAAMKAKVIYLLWQYGLWSFQTGDTNLERSLPKNQHTQRKLLNFEFWINGELSKSAKI